MRRLALLALCALLGAVSAQTGAAGNDTFAVTSGNDGALTTTGTIHPSIQAEPSPTVTPSTTPQSISSHTDGNQTTSSLGNEFSSTTAEMTQTTAAPESSISSTFHPNDTGATEPTTAANPATAQPASTNATENVTFTTTPSIDESLSTKEPNISSTIYPNYTTLTIPTTTLTSNSSTTPPEENITFTTTPSINESLSTEEPNMSSTIYPNYTNITLPTTTLTSNSSTTPPQENITFTTTPSINESLSTEEPNMSSTIYPNYTNITLPTTTLTSNSSTTPPQENVTFTATPSINESLSTKEPNISSTTYPNYTNITLPTTTLNSNSSATSPPPGNVTLTNMPEMNQTTPAPESNTSSTIHPNGTTEPDSNSTVIPTESPPDANRTTVTTGNATSVTTPALDETTATPESNTTSSTVPPNTTNPKEPNATVVSSSTQLPTTLPTGFCTPKSCPPGSVCVQLYANFACQCRPGTFFSGGSCVPAKVFPGDLRLTSLNFTVEMTNTTSKVFAETAASIAKTLRNALQNQQGYLQSIVLQLRKGSVVATVENVFERSSNATQTSLSSAISDAITTCDDCGLLQGANFTANDPCNLNLSPCDTKTAQCSFGKDGIVSCSCKPEYVPTEFSSSSCAACPSGEKAEGGKCVPCPFGYAGFNCNDSALLAVVVVSCVLGGLLLIAIIGLLACCLCRTSKRSWGYSSPYAGNEPAEPFPGQAVPKIPRATANSRWDPSEMEMRENGNARSALANKRPGNGAGFHDVREDELQTFKSKNPSRYSYLVQGQENPYFVPDEGEK